MTVPSVQSTVLNGKLGVRAPGGAELHAYLGCAGGGTNNTPTRHSRTADAATIYLSGPVLELAISGTDRWEEGADFVMVKANATTPGAFGAIDITGFTGTAVPSADATTHPDDDYSIYVKFLKAGNIGTTGITYQTSTDDGNTLSAETALGTADQIIVPNSGGAAIHFDPASSDDTALNTLLNEEKTKLNAHVILITGTVHTSADSADVVATANATNTATRVALANSLRASYEAHHVKGSAATIHINAPGDTVNAMTAPVCTDDEGALAIALDLKAKLNAHEAGTTWHTIADATNGVTSPAPSSGSVNVGDVVRLPCVAPKWGNTDLSNALASLQASLHDWQAVWIAGDCDSSAANAIKTFLASLEAQTGKARKAYFSARKPNSGESESTYLTAVATDYASFAERKTTVCAGAARCQSARTGRPFVFRRPTVFAIAGLPQRLPLGVDMAQRVDATPQGLPGVSLYDANGNNIEHDEMLNPGLDDARFLALRTWPDKNKVVYVNNPSTMEVSGGDFHLDQFVRILDVFCDTARSVLRDELSRELDLNLKDNGPNKAGAPTEAECQRIDGAVREALLVKLAGQVTDVAFALHRDDVILTSQTINGDGGVAFKGYPKLIKFTVAAINPAAAA